MPKLLPVLLLLWCLGGCRRLVDVAPPPQVVDRRTVFLSEESARSALLGLYSQLMASNGLLLLHGGATVYPALAADELVTTAPNATADPFLGNSVPDNSPVVGNNYWRQGYSYIYHANALLEGLEASGSLPVAAKSQLRGEALVVRALVFYYLADFFGGVPLVTTTDYHTSATLGRAPKGDVLERVAADLAEAAALLPPAYPSAGKVRPNRFAALALLARVQLYRGAWGEAEARASEVIASGVYSLAPDPATVFLHTSPEAIWQLLPVVASVNTAEGVAFLPSSPTARPPYALSASLWAAFDSADKRRSAWVKTVTVGGVPYAYPYKYKVRSAAVVTESYSVVRLAELYLVRAEARAQLGQLTEARGDLNAVRGRAGLPAVAPSTKEALLASIEAERRVELAFEWGHRWVDLRRWGRAEAVLGTKAGWQATDGLFPIPFSELQNNPFLTQNPGY